MSSRLLPAPTPSPHATAIPPSGSGSSSVGGFLQFGKRFLEFSRESIGKPSPASRSARAEVKDGKLMKGEYNDWNRYLLRVAYSIIPYVDPLTTAIG